VLIHGLDYIDQGFQATTHLPITGGVTAQEVGLNILNNGL
jgi:hypothetical protein